MVDTPTCDKLSMDHGSIHIAIKLNPARYSSYERRGDAGRTTEVGRRDRQAPPSLPRSYVVPAPVRGTQLAIYQCYGFPICAN